MTLYTVLIVGAGGFVGSIVRFITVQSVDKKLNSVFPYGTLTVNLVGSFILGLILAIMLKKPGIAPEWRLFLATGFCGGFTTFSAFAFENFNLLEQRFVGTSLVYMAISLVAGVLAVAAGMLIGKMF
jgi:CrcB protein